MTNDLKDIGERTMGLSILGVHVPGRGNTRAKALSEEPACYAEGAARRSRAELESGEAGA